MRTTLHPWLRPAPPEVPEAVVDQGVRRRFAIETWLVLGVTLGYSAAQSLLSLVDSLLKPVPLADQKVALNAPQAEVSWVDLATQLVIDARMIGFGLLAMFLLVRTGVGRVGLRLLGLDRSRPWRDLAGAVGLTALIGIPGLALYELSYALGFSLDVQPSVLNDTWWRVPALVVSAFANGWLEETVVVAYLLTRTRQLGWTENAGLAVSAVLRGSYHLYQGFGGFVGNLIMGLIFGRIWQRTQRLWVLIGAHTLLDVVSFVGYALAHGRIPGI